MRENPTNLAIFRKIFLFISKKAKIMAVNLSNTEFYERAAYSRNHPDLA